MADQTKTKAERRQEAGHAAKAERKQAKLRRKQRGAAQTDEPVADGSAADGIESRLASLEKAVAAQSELSERLLQKLDEVLQEARNPST